MRLAACALLGVGVAHGVIPNSAPKNGIMPLTEHLALSTAQKSQRIASIRQARHIEGKLTSVAQRTEVQLRRTGSQTGVRYIHGVKFREKQAGGKVVTMREEQVPDYPTSFQAEGVTTRCGFSWDDAAVKCGVQCKWNADCPHGTWVTDATDGESWMDPVTEKMGMCFADIPTCDGNRSSPMGQCIGVRKGVSDAWCMQVSRTIEGPDSTISTTSFLDQCICEEVPLGLNTPTEENPNPDLKDKNEYKERWDLRQRDDDGGWKVQQAITKFNEAGLQFCAWRPQQTNKKPGGLTCNNHTSYECMEGPKVGYCSDNWIHKEEECSAWCVHELLITLAPYYPVWRYGPRAFPWPKNAQLPHYAAKDAQVAISQSPFEHPTQVLMSSYCKSVQIAFVGVSLFSPKYEPKARRLLNSCNLAGVCCKATEISTMVYGPAAPEGSEEFRFRTIAMKPIFILDQLEKTAEPVVFMDVDLEFHQFPKLFLPGAWPDGHPRDVALFNFWSNETNLTQRHTPNVGSAVAYFNQTYRSKKLLTAWAEAMRYGTNPQAPDDQVLDTLLREGGWLARASVGWLPVSYLRTMPAYYRGVDPVIDHDRGVPPGMIAHSSTKPQMPTVQWYEAVDPVEIAKPAP
jgi:hypothetical protein